MKRIDRIRHLEQHGVTFLGEDGNPNVDWNRAAGKTPTAPSHREINDIPAQEFVKTSRFQIYSPPLTAQLGPPSPTPID